MPELVIPDALHGHSLLDDDRLAPARDLVGRRVYAFDGPLDALLPLAASLSEAASGPVLVNDITHQTDDTRTVDVYMHQGGRQRGVSRGVEQPRPQAS